MVQSIKFQIVALFLVVFNFISCTQVVYERSGFGGTNAKENQLVGPTQKKLKETSHIETFVLLNGDTFKEGAMLSNLKLAQRDIEVTNLLSNHRKFKKYKLLQSTFIQKYGNWIRENIPQNKHTKNAVLKAQNNNSKNEKNKANFNDDVVNIGLAIAGISAGVFLLTLVFAGSGGFSASSNGCVAVLMLLISGFGILGGLITALIGVMI